MAWSSVVEQEEALAALAELVVLLVVVVDLHLEEEVRIDLCFLSFTFLVRTTLVRVVPPLIS